MAATRLPPLAPTNLVVYINGAITPITLRWTRGAKDSCVHYIERSTNASSWSVIGNVKKLGSSFVDPTPAPSTTNYYRVRACYVDGSNSYCSAYSN